jgi:hypothetical protein
MTTTLASLGIDPNNSPYRSADLLLAGQLTALYEYAKSLEERVKGIEDGKEDFCPICIGEGSLLNGSQCRDCGGSGESSP